jgi:hypothetical protein
MVASAAQKKPPIYKCESESAASSYFLQLSRSTTSKYMGDKKAVSI